MRGAGPAARGASGPVHGLLRAPTGAQITICTTGSVDTDEIASEIASALGRSGLHQPFVLIEPAADIARLATGKLKRFIPLEHAARPTSVH